GDRRDSCRSGSCLTKPGAGETWPLLETKLEMDATRLEVLLDGEELAPDLVAAAVDFCVRIGLEADVAVTPGIDCDWEDFPELDDLEDDAPNLSWGNERYGVRAYVEPKCVEIRLPWM